MTSDIHTAGLELISDFYYHDKVSAYNFGRAESWHEETPWLEYSFADDKARSTGVVLAEEGLDHAP